MKTSSTLLGIITGLAVGATLGILLAPDKGEKTRNKLLSKGKEAKDKLKENFDTFLDTVSEKYNSLKEDGEELLQREKEELKDKMKKA